MHLYAPFHAYTPIKSTKLLMRNLAGEKQILQELLYLEVRTCKKDYKSSCKKDKALVRRHLMYKSCISNKLMFKNQALCCKLQ